LRDCRQLSVACNFATNEHKPNYFPQPTDALLDYGGNARSRSSASVICGSIHDFPSLDTLCSDARLLLVRDDHHATAYRARR
jgi:hypothetical protein